MVRWALSRMRYRERQRTDEYTIEAVRDAEGGLAYLVSNIEVSSYIGHELQLFLVFVY